MEFLAGESVQVRIGQRPTLAHDIAVRIVEILRDEYLVRIDEARDVTIAVAVVERG